MKRYLMQKDEHIKTILSKQKFMWIGFATGVLYWFVESWIHVQFFDAISFTSELLNPTAHETWKRLLVVTLFFLFGVYSQYIINILRRAETNLKDRKKELTLMHAELNQIFQTASVGMRVVDKNYNVLRINKTFEFMTGINERNSCGEKCHAVFSGPKCFTPQCPLKLIMNGERSVECFVDKHRKDGVTIPCILTAKRFEDSDGKLVGIIESFKDIRDLKAAQSATQSERDKMHLILSCLTEGVIILNEHFTVEYKNTILKKYFGGSDGKPCYSVFYQQDHPCKNCRMKAAMATGQIQHCELTGPNGRIFEQAYTPVKDFDGSDKVIVLFRDVTEERVSLAAMMHSQQLASLGEMAAGIAHEINNPINGIINYGQILTDKIPRENQSNDIAARIVKEGARIARTVEGLLSFSRRKKGEKIRVHIKKILTDALSLTGTQMQKDNISINMNIPENLPEVIAQPNEIEQVFVNIISNARYALNQKYSGSSPQKIFQVTAVEVKSNGQRYVQVSFRDSGIGIPEKLIDKVMNPFFSTKAVAKATGTGLGLSISLGIIEEHKGHLTIKSQEGEYTTASVELPSWRG